METNTFGYIYCHELLNQLTKSLWFCLASSLVAKTRQRMSNTSTSLIRTCHSLQSKLLLWLSPHWLEHNHFVSTGEPHQNCCPLSLNFLDWHIFFSDIYIITFIHILKFTYSVFSRLTSNYPYIQILKNQWKRTFSLSKMYLIKIFPSYLLLFLFKKQCFIQFIFTHFHCLILSVFI